MNRLINPLVMLILRSPLHGMLSRSLLLLTYRGRKSGKAYTLPVQYVRDGTMIIILPGGAQMKTWWRNLQGGGDVEVFVAGRKYLGRAVVLHGETDPEAAAAALQAYLGGFPASVRLFGLPPGPPQAIPAADLERAARLLVAVRVDLAG